MPLKTKKAVTDTKAAESPVTSYVRYFLTATMLGLPLIVTNGFFNITETKYIYFLVCAVGLIISFLLKHKQDIKPQISGEIKNGDFSILDYTITAFGAFILVSTVLSRYPADAWLGLYARYQGALTVIIYILIYFIVSRFYSSRQNFLLFAVIAFCIVSILGVLNCFDIDFIGFYHKLAPNYKTSYISTIGNINFYSSYFCLTFPLVICGFCQAKKKVSSILYSAALIIGSFGMMVTASESFIMGFTVALAVIPFFFFKSKEKLSRFLLSVVIIILSAQVYFIIHSTAPKTNVVISDSIAFFLKPYISLPVACVCLVAYLLVKKTPENTEALKKIYIAALILIVAAIGMCFLLANTVGLGSWNKYFRFTYEWGTFRGKIWDYCLDLFKEYNFKELLFGTGPETLQHLTAKGRLFEGKSVDQAHNIYLQYLMTTGICGLLAYVSVLISTAVIVIKHLRKNALAVGIFASLIACWIQGTVNIAQPFTTPIMYIYIACIGGMLCLEKRNKNGIRTAEKT